MSPALFALFDGPGRRAVRRLRLQGGERLFNAEDAPDHLFLVRAGLLAASAGAADGRLLGLIRPGEPVGEMALLADTPHTNSVAAVRDSVVDALPVAAFRKLVARHPPALAELASIAVHRSRGGARVTPAARAVLVAAISPGLDPRPFTQRLADAVTRLGLRAVAVDSTLAGGPDWLQAAEADCDLVLIAAASNEDGWAAQGRRQVDRVLLLGRGDDRPPPECAMCETEPLQRHRLVDLVLTRPARAAIAGSAAWLAAAGAARLFHVDEAGSGIDRIARVLTGRSVGLVLSGGGARAFAHVGVVAALRAAGVPIDFVAGTSMGAIVAAGVANGWDEAELDMHMRRAFVDSNPLDDVSMPIVAMTRGRKVEARLREHFGETDILDLAMPFFCVSADLTVGRHHRHAAGSLATALRASISLPGILPPVILDGRVLVDGGVLRNLPTDLMRGLHDGPVIGSDVTRDMGLEPADCMPPRSWLRWFGSGAWRRGPPIVSVLMRSATVANAAEIAIARAASDVYVMPDLADVEIRDWPAYPRAVEAGAAAMKAVLATLERPISELRVEQAPMVAYGSVLAG